MLDGYNNGADQIIKMQEKATKKYSSRIITFYLLQACCLELAANI